MLDSEEAVPKLARNIIVYSNLKDIQNNKMIENMLSAAIFYVISARLYRESTLRVCNHMLKNYYLESCYEFFPKEHPGRIVYEKVKKLPSEEYWLISKTVQKVIDIYLKGHKKMNNQSDMKEENTTDNKGEDFRDRMKVKELTQEKQAQNSKNFNSDPNTNNVNSEDDAKEERDSMDHYSGYGY